MEFVGRLSASIDAEHEWEGGEREDEPGPHQVHGQLLLMGLVGQTVAQRGHQQTHG